MKKYFLTLTGMSALLLLLGSAVVAQDRIEKREKNKREEYEKEKYKEDKEKKEDSETRIVTDGNDEIIIKRKGDGNGKVVIEIRDDEVFVNGKPLDEFDDDNISVRKRKNQTYRLVTPSSPFRGQNNNWYLENSELFNDNQAFLGVSTDESEDGAKVVEVTDGSAAEKAGLKKGDVITQVGDDKIENPADLTKAIRKHKPDEKVTVTFERNGDEKELTAKLGKRKGMNLNINPQFEFSPRIEALPDMKDFNFEFNDGELGNMFAYGGKGRLGIKAQDTDDGKGVKVLDVDESSAAEKAGIRKDDIITEFDGKDVNSADELADAARDSREKTSVEVKIRRNGRSETVEIKTPRKLKSANL